MQDHVTDAPIVNQITEGGIDFGLRRQAVRQSQRTQQWIGVEIISDVTRQTREITGRDGSLMDRLIVLQILATPDDGKAGTHTDRQFEHRGIARLGGKRMIDSVIRHHRDRKRLQQPIVQYKQQR